MVGTEGVTEVEEGNEGEQDCVDGAGWFGGEDLPGCGARLVVFFVVVVGAGVEVW